MNHVIEGHSFGNNSEVLNYHVLCQQAFQLFLKDGKIVFSK